MILMEKLTNYKKNLLCSFEYYIMNHEVREK